MYMMEFSVIAMTLVLFEIIDGTLTATTTPHQSGSESNDNERVPHISKNSKTGASSLGDGYCHIQDTCWWSGVE